MLMHNESKVRFCMSDVDYKEVLFNVWNSGTKVQTMQRDIKPIFRILLPIFPKSKRQGTQVFRKTLRRSEI